MSRLYEKNRDLSQKLERIEVEVHLPDEGRFDIFLASKLRWRSREGVKELIEEGKARRAQAIDARPQEPGALGSPVLADGGGPAHG